MTAERIARVLGRARRAGTGWLAACPVPGHGRGRGDCHASLSITDVGGRLLVGCLAGCTQAAVIEALRVRELWPGRPKCHWRPNPEVERRSLEANAAEEWRRIEAAHRIWQQTKPTPGTLVETYVKSRGITIPVPPTLRYHASALYDRTGLHLPCIVAAVQAPDRRITAVHRTYIRGDGQGKADVSTPKKALGPLKAGAVRLGSAGPVLGLAEGVETGLSAMQLFGVPVWAALGSRLHRVQLPNLVREVHLFADNGRCGYEAAEKAANAFTVQGRRVVLRFPPERFGDWNDVHSAEVSA